MGILVSKMAKLNSVVVNEAKNKYQSSIIMSCICVACKPAYGGEEERRLSVYANPSRSKLHKKVEKRLYKKKASEYIIHCNTCSLSKPYLIAMIDSKLHCGILMESDGLLEFHRPQPRPFSRDVIRI